MQLRYPFQFFVYRRTASIGGAVHCNQIGWLVTWHVPKRSEYVVTLTAHGAEGNDWSPSKPRPPQFDVISVKATTNSWAGISQTNTAVKETRLQIAPVKISDELRARQFNMERIYGRFSAKEAKLGKRSAEFKKLLTQLVYQKAKKNEHLSITIGDLHQPSTFFASSSPCDHRLLWCKPLNKHKLNYNFKKKKVAHVMFKKTHSTAFHRGKKERQHKFGGELYVRCLRQIMTRDRLTVVHRPSIRRQALQLGSFINPAPLKLNIKEISRSLSSSSSIITINSETATFMDRKTPHNPGSTFSAL